MNDDELDRLVALASGKLPENAPRWEPQASRRRRMVLLNGYAEALCKSNEWVVAETIYNVAAPDSEAGYWGLPGLARARTARGDHEGAVAAWFDALEKFTNQAKPHWYDGLADALSRLGRRDEAARIRGQLADRFPGALSALMFRAREAERANNWDAALAFWTDCDEVMGENPRPAPWLGQAQALYRLGFPEAAIATYRKAIAKFPAEHRVYQGLLFAARDLGLWTIVKDCADRLIADFSTEQAPVWLAEKARALFNQRRMGEFEAAFAALATAFPDSEDLAVLMLETAVRQLQGLQETLTVARAAFEKFPSNRTIRAEYVRNLLANGNIDTAAHITAGLVAEVTDHAGSVALWRLTIDRDGNEAFKTLVQAAINSKDFQQIANPSFGAFLLGTLQLWAAEATVTLCGDLMRRFPGRPMAGALQAKALIMLRRDDEAAGVIATLPACCRLPLVLELRAWAAAWEGDLARAREISEDMLSESYVAHLHAPTPNLVCLREPAATAPEGVMLFLVVRNDAARLLEFFRHYRRLGIRHFVVVDNDSSDSSLEFLANQPDVWLYHTADGFYAAGSGMRWKHELIETHARGGWCVSVDADEALIYPGWENMPLDAFTEYLDRTGAEAVSAYMLDLYPARLFTPDGTVVGQAEHIYYDADYEWLGLIRPPYVAPIGGVRQRLFGAHEMLHKVPLFKSSRGTILNSHECTPMRFAKVTAALLHYKLLSLAETYVGAPAERREMANTNNRGPETMRRYQRYESRFAALQDKDLRVPGLTQALADSWTLNERGVFHAPPDFRAWRDAFKQALLF